MKAEEGMFLLLLTVTAYYLSYYISFLKSRGSAVGIATGYGLDDKSGRSSNSSRFKNFLHVVQIASRVYTASFPMDTGGYFPWG
jgi:hypothetical protein